MKLKKQLLPVILLLTGVIFFFIRKIATKNDSLIFAEVKKGDFVITVTSTGELEAVSSVNIEVPKEMQNKYVQINEVKIQDIVPEGTIVDSGEYVAKLDKTELYGEIKQIEFAIEDTRNELYTKKLDTALQMREAKNNLFEMDFQIEEAKIAYEQSKYEPPATIRKNKLAYEKLIREKKQVIVKLEYTKKQQELSIKDIEYELQNVLMKLESMHALLNKFFITAPRKGMIVYKRERNGQKRTIGSKINPFDPIIATLPDLSRMISRTYINEIDISKIKTGQEVRITVDAFPDKTYKGVVTYISNMGQTIPINNTKLYEVEIELDNSNLELRPSMTTKNDIQIASFNNVLYLPIEAIHRDTVAYVFLNPKTKQIVIPGNKNNNHVIITQGLNYKDKVLLSIPDSKTHFRVKKISKISNSKSNLQVLSK